MGLTKFTEKLISDSFKTSISGSDNTESASFSSRVTLVEGGTTSKTLVSSSAQIATDISGSFNSTSSSLASRVTVNEGRVNQGVKTTDSPTFAGGTVTGDFTVGGTLTAQEVHTEFESASILFTSGSTIFGNSSDDVHNMTGSMNISGSLTLNDGDLTVTDNVDFNGDLDVDGTTNLDNTDIDGTLTVDGGNIVFNEDSADQDFRVESNGQTHMLFVDGGNNRVGIGISNPSYPLVVSDGGGLGFEFSPDHAGGGYNMLQNYNRSGTAYVPIRYVASQHEFINGGTEKLKITSAGHVSASGNISIIKGNAMLRLEESGGSKAYLFSGGSFTALRTTSNTPLQFGANYSSADTFFIGQNAVTSSLQFKVGTVSDGGKALITDGVDGGAYDVLVVRENGAARWDLVFEGNAATNDLTINSNAQSNVANIKPDGTIYFGAQQSTLAKNTSHRLNVQAPANTGAWVSTFANNSYPTFQLYRTNNTSIGSYTVTANNDIIGAINWHGSSASAHTLGASIDVRQVGTDDCDPNTPTKMDFYVSNGANISNEILSLDGPTQGATFAAMLKSVFFRTDSSTTSIANNTATNISGLTGISSGLYLIHVYREDYDPNSWAAHGIIRATGHSSIHGTFTNTAGMVLSVSGNNVQLTHQLGSTHNITANWIRIA